MKSFHCAACGVGWLLFLAVIIPVANISVAQPTILFGSSDDPREVLQHVWWRRENTFQVMGGASLIGPQWRAATNVGLSFVGRSFTGRMSGTFRLGVLGEYGADVDEAYDLLRLVEFIRYNPPTNSSVHLRLGPLDRIQLGAGHVVNLFNSNVAYDDRTVGVEFGGATPLLTFRLFTDNVLLHAVAGGRSELAPLF